MRRFFSRGKESDGSPESLPHFSPSTVPQSSPVTGPARPIRLVYYDEKGKFRMDPEAVAALQLVKEPIGVVSVCGRARQGKSFILNQVTGSHFLEFFIAVVISIVYNLCVTFDCFICEILRSRVRNCGTS